MGEAPANHEELRQRLLRRTGQFFIGGAWAAPRAAAGTFALIDPATEQQYGELALGSAADVDAAVAAAREAFESYGQTTLDDRRALLTAILNAYNRRADDIAEAISLEMGAPIGFARDAQTPRGSAHIAASIRALDKISFDEPRGATLITHEPIGVCGLITPWNWPMNQLAVKVAPALAAGCAMVLKPSEFSPLSALLFAEILAEAGVPDGVFNLINGTGAEVGQAIVTHPGIDMISFTGSTRAGIQIARAAADTVKRVGQELGGKSPNILLPDVDLQDAVSRGVAACFTNSGQSCSIPTRMLVPLGQAEAAAAIARATAESFTSLGPLVNKAQFDRVQALIAQAIAEGATLVAGGLGRPDGIARGFYVKPTVFCDVTPDMTIAQEEVFGPVLVIMPYTDEADAIRIANDSSYGLAAYVQTRDLDRARKIARRLRAGGVHINYPPADFDAPFGGFKKSGNGREWGDYGVREFMEVKSIVGYGV